MRRLATVGFLLILVLAALSVQPAAQAQGTPKVSVESIYTLNKYGFATINESVTFSNGGSSPVTPPSLTFGFGNLSSDVAGYMLVGSNFTLATPSSEGGPFTVSGAQSLPAGENDSYVLMALVNDVATVAKNGSLSVAILSSPSISSKVDSLLNVVQMPVSTAFSATPTGMTATISGSNNTYSSTASEVTPKNATTSVNLITSNPAEDFNPLRVFSAVRTVSIDSSGNPVVTDTVTFQNLGTVALGELYINPIAPEGASAIVETASEPKLLTPIPFSLSNGYIPLTQVAPNAGVPAGANLTLSYQYPLSGKYYTESGGQVVTNIPLTPPIGAFIDSYTVQLSLSHGATSSKSAPTTLTSVTPWGTGTAQFSYGLSLGWTIDGGVPLATFVFTILLIGLFALRTTGAEAEEEEEEESSSELAATMIKAFDEKTNLINSLWPEISSKDPNEVDKAYFDEVRGRLDTFRSRALQRLNEVKQKSTSQRFSDVVNQIAMTEREVDRAAKDKLNLYQQYTLRQMRKDVYDRLLPQYTKRLEKALNQLSDELHTVQRESKLL